MPQLRHTIIAASIAGVLALTTLSALASPPAHAAGVTFRYQRGYSIQRGWLCYGWPSGAYHCTQHWRVSGGRYVSLNPAWVPSEGSVSQTSHASVVSVHTSAYQATYRNTYPYGQCTWGAQQLRRDENLSGLGNAKDWLWNAERRGLPTGYTPRVGATVVFAPGVDGASWLGHVGHVVAVGSGGRFEIEAMNDAAGWGRYAFRWVQMRVGVSFIY
jgi:surface antigen